jgi:very-short-patch-repair endonuclease
MDAFKNITQLARDLRKRQTESEKILWQELRNRNLDRFKFLRQHPIVYAGTAKRPLFFIVDFYCAERALVIEVDGGIHEHKKEEDYQRDLILGSMGLVVVRIKNEELGNMEEVKTKIRRHLY